MRFHLDMRAVEYEKAGLSPEDARREALKRFGSPLLARERVRDVRLLTWLDSVRTGHLAGRAAAAAVAAARGGRRCSRSASASARRRGVFAVGDALMFRPLPVQRPGELVVAAVALDRVAGDRRLGDSNDADNNTFSFSYPTYERLAATPGIDLAGIQDLNHAMVVVRGNAGTADGALVTGNFFRVLGLVPAAGRLLVDADNSLSLAARRRPEPPVLAEARSGATRPSSAAAVRLNGRRFVVAAWRRATSSARCPAAGRISTCPRAGWASSRRTSHARRR